LRKNNRGGEFDQRTSYACKKYHYGNSFVHLIHVNENKIKSLNLGTEVKIRDEINEMEAKRIIQIINETELALQKNKQDWQTFS
jgi:hypothetical protein